MRGFHLTLGPLFVALSAVGAEARAQGPISATPQLLFFGCEPSERQAATRLVALDLAAGDRPLHPERGNIEVRCQGGRYDITVERADGQALTRAVDLQQVPARARPRIVAIIAVEMFAADVDEAPTLGRPAPEPLPPEGQARGSAWTHPTEPGAVPSTSVPPRGACCRMHLEVAASGRTFLGGGPRLLGGGMRGEVSRGLLAMDALAEFGSVSATEGTAHVTSLSSSVTVGWSMARGPTATRLGAGVRAGVARLSGEPVDPLRWSGRASWRGWGGPELEASVAFYPSPSSAVQITIEGGYALWAIAGLGVDGHEVEIRGPWIGLQIGGGIGL